MVETGGDGRPSPFPTCAALNQPRPPADYPGDVHRIHARAGRRDQAGDRRPGGADRRERPLHGRDRSAACAAAGASSSFASALAQASSGYGSPTAAAAAMLSGAAAPASGLAGSAVPGSPYALQGMAGVGGATLPYSAGTGGSRIVAIAESQLGQAEQPPGLQRIAGDRRIPQRHRGGDPRGAVVRLLRLVGRAPGGRADRRGRPGPRLGLGDLVLGAEHRSRGPNGPGRGAQARRPDRLRRRARGHRQGRAAERTDPDDRGQLRKQGRRRTSAAPAKRPAT